jgi:succinate dehydrogenase flavin-adding protein (antitoxin of CptAB toxin-antitoxin module)
MDRLLIMTAFEFDGIIVEFNMECWEDEAETEKEYFNYLLDTFDITLY